MEVVVVLLLPLVLVFNGLLMRRECHGHSERTAAAPGLFQIGEQRVHHLHDGPGRRPERDEAPGSAVQDVVGDGGDSGGGVADCLHHGALSLPEHVHIAGKKLANTHFNSYCALLCATCGKSVQKCAQCEASLYLLGYSKLQQQQKY